MPSPEFVDGAPNTDFPLAAFKDNRFSALIAPYVSFDPNYARFLSDAKRYSKETGVLPVAALQIGTLSIHSTFVILDSSTPYVEILRDITVQEQQGHAKPGSAAKYAQELFTGDF